MHILMSGMSGNRGGKETYIFGMARELVKLGMKVDFVTVDNPMAYEDDAKTLGCRIWHIPQRSASLSTHKRALSDVYRANRYDMVWSHKTTLSSMEDIEIAKKIKIPIRIVHSHCTENMGSRLTAVLHALHRRSVGKIATHRYACSDAAGKYFYPRGVPFEIKKNAFDLMQYAPDDATRKKYREQLGLEGKFVVGHAGRLSPEKNHAKILEVFYELTSIHPDSTLVLCGTGPLHDNITAYAREHGIEDKVMMLGSRNDMPSLLQAFDLFIFPSLHEGLPYAPLEAQAAGVPCIMSDAVSDDAIYSVNAIKMSLETSSHKWAAQCLELGKRERQSAIPAMRDDGLDIEIEARKMFNCINYEMEI